MQVESSQILSKMKACFCLTHTLQRRNDMQSKFFIRNAPAIIIAAVVGIHLIGYVAEKYFIQTASIWIWLFVAIIDLAFGFKSGRLIQELYRGRFKDSLTGLNNREFFYLFLREQLAKTRKNSSQTALIMIDIDDFKQVNDRHGHIAGDKVLKMVADVFRKHIRSSDVAVRWGGEEFAIVLPGTTTEGAHLLAERLRRHVEKQEFVYKGRRLQVTISLGVAAVDKYVGAEGLVELADKALYKAKMEKNIVSVCC